MGGRERPVGHFTHLRSEKLMVFTDSRGRTGGKHHTATNASASSHQYARNLRISGKLSRILKPNRNPRSDKLPGTKPPCAWVSLRPCGLASLSWNAAVADGALLTAFPFRRGTSPSEDTVPSPLLNAHTVACGHLHCAPVLQVRARCFPAQPPHLPPRGNQTTSLCCYRCQVRMALFKRIPCRSGCVSVPRIQADVFTRRSLLA